MIIEWNLLFDHENDIRKAFEFVDIYKANRIIKGFEFINMFTNYILLSRDNCPLKVKIMIKEKLKIFFNKEINIKESFMERYKNKRINIIKEKKVNNR